MDTISRESSPSYLPIAGLIAGLVGLLLGGIALANAAKANKAVTAVQAEQTTKFETIDASVASATSASERAASNVASLQRSTQDAITAIAGEMAKTNGEIAKLQEAVTKASTAPAKAAGAGKAADGKAKGPVVAGPDEYVIKAGDTFAKIARAQGVSLSDVQTVNQGVDSSKLKVGQKIKLPAKK